MVNAGTNKDSPLHRYSHERLTLNYDNYTSFDSLRVIAGWVSVKFREFRIERLKER